MRGVPARLGDAAVLAGHRLGWAAVRRMPERAAYRLFDAVADVTVARGGAARMRANYARVRPELDDAALDALVRDGMRSYLRYYCEAFRLPELGPDELAARVRLEGDGPVREVLDAGGSVVCFLGHLGNWDLAGAWCTVHLGPVTTVAERLEPEEVFREFLAFREGLGMTILPLTGWARRLPGAARGRPPARPRPAARRPRPHPPGRHRRPLRPPGADGARSRGPRPRRAAAAVPGVDPARARGRGWGIVITFHPAVTVPETGATREKVVAMVQQCADALGSAVREHTADWHMLQRVFLEDLDEDRLARQGVTS